MRIFGWIAALCIAASAAYSSYTPYSKIEAAVGDLEKSSYTAIGTAGKSSEGRNIRYFIITDPRTDPRQKLRVLVISGQHGNEGFAPIGVMALSKHLAFDEDERMRNLRKRVLFIIVPAVNPDGLTNNTRQNALGADLNRDWLSQKQDEVCAVVKLDRAWNPEVVIDAHEWLDGDRGDANFIETCTQSSGRIKDSVLSDPALGILRSVESRAGASEALAHRYFSRRGALGFLIETHREKDPSTHTKIYERSILSLVVKALASRGERGYRQCAPLLPEAPAFNKVPAVRAEAKPQEGHAAVFVMLGSYALIVAVLKVSSIRTVERRKRRHIRIGGVLPRPEHDVLYWMNRPGLDCHSDGKRRSVML